MEWKLPAGKLVRTVSGEAGWRPVMSRVGRQ
ncbi:hypothetical protein Pcinc_043359, partial [Petrolisthes cinctipes]